MPNMLGDLGDLQKDQALLDHAIAKARQELASLFLTEVIPALRLELQSFAKRLLLALADVGDPPKVT